MSNWIITRTETGSGFHWYQVRHNNRVMATGITAVTAAQDLNRLERLYGDNPPSDLKRRGYYGFFLTEKASGIPGGKTGVLLSSKNLVEARADLRYKLRKSRLPHGTKVYRLER